MIDKFTVLEAVSRRDTDDEIAPSAIAGPTASNVELDAAKSLEEKKKEFAIKATEETEAARVQLIKERQEKEIEKEKEHEERKSELKKAIFSGLQTGFDSVFEIANTQLDQQTQSRLSAVDIEYQRRIDAAQGNTAEQELSLIHISEPTRPY